MSDDTKEMTLIGKVTGRVPDEFEKKDGGVGTRYVITVLEDGRQKPDKWSTFDTKIYEAVAIGKRYEFDAELKKGPKGYFRNILKLTGEASPQASTRGSGTGQQHGERDYTPIDRDRALDAAIRMENNRTALAVAAINAATLGTPAPPYTPKTLEDLLRDADRIYAWIARTPAPTAAPSTPPAAKPAQRAPAVTVPAAAAPQAAPAPTAAASKPEPLPDAPDLPKSGTDTRPDMTPQERMAGLKTIGIKTMEEAQGPLGMQWQEWRRRGYTYREGIELLQQRAKAKVAA